MTENYLFDTNVLIDFLNGEPIVYDLVNQAIATRTAYYSPITWIELLCYPQQKPIRKLKNPRTKLDHQPAVDPTD